MHPFLLDTMVGHWHLKIPTYGVLLALAFTAGYFIGLYWGARLDLPVKHVENLFLTVVLCSVVGSRLFHVAFEEPSYYWANPVKILAIWEGGYTFYGALLAALLGFSVYCYKYKIDFFNVCDIGALSTTMGLFIGRLGCLAAGCCWGRPCDLPWAVTFTHPETFSEARNIPLHPTQVYESFGALLIFFYLLRLIKRRQYTGQVLFHGLVLYAILRFIIEFFRGDEYRGYVLWGTVSYSQFVSLILLALALTGMYYFRSRRPQKHKK